MAWIQATRRKDGSQTYWVRDRRDGQQIVIAAGATLAEARLKLEQYEIRRDLEKEGYGDSHEQMLDKLWGPKDQIFRKASEN